MAHTEHFSTPPQVPADMVAAHRAGWHAFTHWVTKTCVATAAVLFLLLLVFRVF